MTDVLERIRARQAAKPSIPISIPEWGIEAFVRPLSAGRVAGLQKTSNPARMLVQAIIWGVVDEKGEPVFKDDAETMAALVGEDHHIIERVSTEILRPGVPDLDAAKNS